MNAETPSQNEKDEITSLVAKSAHELSTRGSLVTRGLQDIRKSIQADPSRLAEEAIKLHSLGKFAEAVAVCNSALGTDPDFEVLLLQIKGASLAKQGRVLEGLECIDKALRVNSEDPLCWYVKSRLLQMANRTEERLESLRRVVGVESSVKGAWKDLGSCLLELRRYEEAVEAFDSGLRQNSSDEDCRSQKEIALAELARRQLDSSAHVQDINWNQPAIIGYLYAGWPEADSPKHGPGGKWVTLVCELINIGDSALDLRGDLVAFSRSQTGELTALTDARLIDPVALGPHGTGKADLEFVWTFGEKTSDENCIKEILDNSPDLLVYDKTSKITVVISSDERTYRELELNLRYVTCEECGSEYSPGTLKLLPISEALRFDLWPDNMKMFFCRECDMYVVMSPPHINEE